MISDKDKLIKISFYYKPREDEDTDYVRQMVYDTFDPFRLYRLELKDTTIEKERENESR